MNIPTPETQSPEPLSSPELPPVELTPLMKQYNELKAKAGDALMFFRMGDFYELFGDDAVTASRLLEITLTSRDKGKTNPMPMAGVPHHSAQGYIQRLLKLGQKVAICEQFEEQGAAPRGGAKTIVRREIVRTFTPAVQFDHEGSESVYLATAVPFPFQVGQERRWALACLDPSTGEALVSSSLNEDELGMEVGNLPVRHLICVEGFVPESPRQALSALGTLIENLPPNYLSAEQAVERLKGHYQVSQLDAFIADEPAAQALGILLTYSLRSQQQERMPHLRLPQPLHQPRTLVMGPRAPQHLDLLPGTDGSPNLFHSINRTRSSLGARQLKRWLLHPLRVVSEITHRQRGVQELSLLGNSAEKISETLAGLYDLERITGRLNARLANPRDTLALGKSLATLPSLVRYLASAQSPMLTELRSALEAASAQLEDLATHILKSQRDDAPLISRDGKIFNRGLNTDLDRLLSLTEDGERWLIQLEAEERGKTGIPTLKVRYNRVFGYYLEVTQSHLKNVPAHYQRKQTTVGAERFFTEELKKFEDEIITASSKLKTLEQQLFEELVTSIQTQTRPIMEASRVLGELDAALSLSRLTAEPGWCFPIIDDSRELSIIAGRHPLVDSVGRGRFVPNDMELSPATRLTLLITGPNMGGKSTVMRQVALIVILGQMGAAVPAVRAHWGAFSSLYTRIGAHDAISRGQSTFMVEMSELAHILHHADEHSLIILDEIGRGTSTYDGMSVAWATLEWICNRICSRTLFATHYHELTRLAGLLPCLANAHMGVEGTRAISGGSLRFLYQLKDGPANESFGIHVARLAGLPAPVVERAWSVLEELEALAAGKNSAKISTAQLSLFDVPSCVPEAVSPSPREPLPEWISELVGTDVNGMTPIQALNYLAQMQVTARATAESQ